MIMREANKVIVLGENFQNFATCEDALRKVGIDPIFIQSKKKLTTLLKVLQEDEPKKIQETICLSSYVYVDFRHQVIRRKDLTISITGTEFRILKALYSRLSNIYPTMDLIDAVWGHSPVGLDSLYVYIRRIREKLENNPRKPELLITHHGYGYELRSKKK